MHWDNYPKRMVGVIAELVARDGIEQVCKTLISDNPSWSQVEPMATTGTSSLYEQHKLVEGYGYAHTDVTLEDSDLFTHADKELAWADYLYVITDVSLEIYNIERNAEGHDVPMHYASHAWNSEMAERFS